MHSFQLQHFVGDSLHKFTVTATAALGAPEKNLAHPYRHVLRLKQRSCAVALVPIEVNHAFAGALLLQCKPLVHHPVDPLALLMAHHEAHIRKRSFPRVALPGFLNEHLKVVVALAVQVEIEIE